MSWKPTHRPFLIGELDNQQQASDAIDALADRFLEMKCSDTVKVAAILRALAITVAMGPRQIHRMADFVKGYSEVVLTQIEAAQAQDAAGLGADTGLLDANGQPLLRAEDTMAIVTGLGGFLNVEEVPDGTVEGAAESQAVLGAGGNDGDREAGAGLRLVGDREDARPPVGGDDLPVASGE